MSKGIVMEKHRKYTIVMTIDGCFHKVRPIEDGIGTEVSYEILASKKRGLLFFQSNKGSSMPVRYIAIICMILLFVMPFYLLGGQNKTYAYVNLDINPSLEIEVDNDLSVVSISPLNDDAERLIKQLLDYKDIEIEQVIEDIMNKSDALGLTKNGKNVLVGVSYVNGQDIAILDTVDKYFLTHNTSWDIATFKVPKEIRERALKENISMNKLMADTIDERTPDSEIKIIQSRVNDDEKELIHSFYTNSQSEHQNSKKNVPVSNNQDSKDSTIVPQPEKEKKMQYPGRSEQKKKNGVIHSHGKNQHDNSVKPKEKDNKHKEKQQHKHKKDKQMKNGKQNNGNDSHRNQGNHGKNGNHGKKGNHKHKEKTG